jgi:uncharacterized membrane protein YphA (DoxX/SURF4 family)
MNVAIVTARILLGSIFVVFGLNGFLHFLPQPPVPEAAGAFFGALAATGYMLPLVFGAQLVGGGLVLAGMVPLGVAILAPVIVNIVFFHLFLAPAGMGPAAVVTVLALFLTWAHRDAYAALFATTDRASARATQRRAA